MEGRRMNNHRRSQNTKPPRGSWQNTVPAWEKEFCKVVGSMNWETLVHTKKFLHLYDNVIEWNDSAGEEAFSNAKKRYWATKNGLFCDLSLPDPDLYIDKINWDSENDPKLLSDVESLPMSPRTGVDHDPVVIFGDSIMPNQVFPPIGWGDDEENLVVPATHSLANYVEPWGHSSNEWATAAWPGYSNGGWQGYSNDAWQYSNGSGHGYLPWEGDWNNWISNYANSYYNYVGPDIRDTWDDGYNAPTTYKTTMVEANEQRRKHIPRNGEGHDKTPYKRSSTREWNPNSIRVGQSWDQE